MSEPRGPEDEAALLAQAFAHSREGRLQDALACARAAHALAPESVEPNALTGGILVAMGQPSEALEFLERARRLAPNRPDVINNLGAALRTLERHREALPLFAQALALQPAYADARYNLAGAYFQAGSYVEAIEEYRALAALGPSASVQSGLAKALYRVEHFSEGREAFQTAIDLEPQRIDTYLEYGNALVETGHLAEASAVFLRGIELAPDRGDFYRLLAETMPEALDDSHVAHLERLADPGAHSDIDGRIDANFALSRIHAHRGDRSRSFAHLAVANAQRRSEIAYDERETLASFERIASVFTVDFISSRAGCSDPATEPVFILGMPRSGTTLVEQVLASHPAVYGAGELELFEQITSDVLAGEEPMTPAAMRDAACDRLREIGRRYASELRARAPGPFVRITDKMPANFRFAGLISIVLPNARMIHTVRNAVDTCLSCFTQYFQEGQSWSYDLAELGRYYRGYAHLMDHWRAVVPSTSLLEVRYEDVVEDFEVQARRIVAFCGLDWDDACLEFYKTKRPVRTASATQVRQPIYRSSVDRARGYGELLNPLTDALGPSTSSG